MAVSTESDDLKLLFIEEELSQHGEWVCDLMYETLEKKQLVNTGDLESSVEYNTFKEGDKRGLRISFLSYGRAVDIAAYKKNRHEVNTNREIWGISENRKKPKNNRWYATNMYSGINTLISRIMYGLTDKEIARLKNILENRKNKNTI